MRYVSSLDHQQYIHDFKILLRLKKEKDKLQQDYDRFSDGPKTGAAIPPVSAGGHPREKPPN